MNKKIELLAVTVLAILYGVLTKVLINIPFMAWRAFDWIFWIAFVLCCGFNAVLYLLADIYIKGSKNYRRGIIYSCVFGTNTALLKLVMDTMIDAVYSRNYIRKIGIITFENILFGIIIIAFLFLVIGKKKIQLKLDKFILPLFILCVIGVSQLSVIACIENGWS